MATKLEKPLKRELSIDGKPYMLTIEPRGMKLVPKGKRKGQEIAWEDLVNGAAPDRLDQRLRVRQCGEDLSARPARGEGNRRVEGARPQDRGARDLCQRQFRQVAL
jgi:hypothetical protein